MIILKDKVIHIMIFAYIVIFAVILLFPFGNKVLTMIHYPSYVNRYSVPKDLKPKDLSALPPAKGVPVLMYHGVINSGVLGSNTERETFIAQMEMLKREGYETISVKEYDLFRQNKFTLPAKPIIITFDDGRKDSFYTVDRVLEKLNFKATTFIATIKANENDPFYLSWEELKKVQATGRWEIEAHGRHSHDHVPIDEHGTIGTYLTSRFYLKGKGLEAMESYRKRVEQDYKDGIEDLKINLGVNATYFAVPLNDYGDYEVTNNEEAYSYNQELTRKFFKLAFIQAEKIGDKALDGFYNYPDSIPYQIKRLEVENMSADSLLEALNRGSEKEIPYTDVMSYASGWISTWGKLDFENGRMHLNAENSGTGASAWLDGSNFWKNYRFTTKLDWINADSISLFGHYKINNNESRFIECNFSKGTVKLENVVNGVTTHLIDEVNSPNITFGENKSIGIGFNENVAGCLWDGKVIIKTAIPSNSPSEGGIGIEIWNKETSKAHILIHEISVIDTTKI